MNILFGKSPIKQKPQTLVQPGVSEPAKQKTKESRDNRQKKKKRKREDGHNDLSLEDHFDDGFEATLSLLDEEKLGITPTKNGGNATSSEDVTPVRPKTTPKIENKAENSNKKITPKKDLTPNSGTVPGSEDKPDQALLDSEQKKKDKVASYQRFLQRKGPRNPGSKPIPEGAPNCLQGKAFVISGELESLCREEATELIQKYGGRCTTSVSRKTNFILLGEEPGESKLKKAEQLNIPQLSEDGLLDLIRNSRSEKTPIQTKENGSAKLSVPKNKNSLSKAKKLKFDEPKHELTDSGFSSCSSSSNTESKPIKIESHLGDTLWVEKYKPHSTKAIIGQNGDKSNVKKLTKWLNDWHKNHSGHDKKKAARPGKLNTKEGKN